MANALPMEKRLAILSALVDGNSERAVERMTEVSRPTIARFGLIAGTGAVNLHNRLVRNLDCREAQVDEIFSYVKVKQARFDPAKHPAWAGEAYTFVGLDKASRLVISWHVGRRDETSARIFARDFRSRLETMPEITSDGFVPYIAAFLATFGISVNYSQCVKNYRNGAKPQEDGRYEPPRDPFITKRTVFGSPDLDRASTAYIERNNGTMRHKIGRMRRLVYAFSKDIEHHRAAVALNYVHYNLCHVVRTLRVTPAMQAGLTSHVWSNEEFLGAILSAEPCDPPEAKPLRHIAPEGTAKPLPAGRGFLRALPGGKGSGAPSAPVNPPAAPAVAVGAAPAVAPSPVPVPAPEAATSATPATDDRQLDLFAWKPRPKPAEPPSPPRTSAQLDLFGPGFEPGGPTGKFTSSEGE